MNFERIHAVGIKPEVLVFDATLCCKVSEPYTLCFVQLLTTSII